MIQTASGDTCGCPYQKNHRDVMMRVIGVLGAVARSAIGSPLSGTTVIHGARTRFGEVHRALGRTPCARPRRMDRLGRLTPF